MVGPGGGEETPKEAKRNGVVPPLFFSGVVVLVKVKRHVRQRASRGPTYYQ
jgi:hypothetical protein